MKTEAQGRIQPQPQEGGNNYALHLAGSVGGSGVAGGTTINLATGLILPFPGYIRRVQFGLYSTDVTGSRVFESSLLDISPVDSYRPSFASGSGAYSQNLQVYFNLFGNSVNVEFEPYAFYFPARHSLNIDASAFGQIPLTSTITADCIIWIVQIGN